MTIESEVISPFFTMAFPSVSNSDGEGISSEKINLNIEKVLSYGFLLNASEGHSYSGPLSIVLEDVIHTKTNSSRCKDLLMKTWLQVS